MTRCRIIISALWWGPGLAILLMFVSFTFNPSTFGQYSGQALDWIIPHLIPTMTLTGAVVIAQQSSDGQPLNPQMRYAFFLTCLLSVFYMGLIAAVILAAVSGQVPESERGAVDALNSWNKLLGVFQGLCASAIGVFFVRSESARSATTRP